MSDAHDAIVVGAGPNGLAAAITLQRAGWRVLVVEAAPVAGGGCRSEALTLPGFVHDTCSAVHPLALASPLFRSLPLADYGVAWVQPPTPLAHPLDDGTAAVLAHSVEQTAAGLGDDAAGYRRLMQPLVANWQALTGELLGPLRLPHHPVLLARFGLRASWSARWLAERAFRGTPARALLAGLAAHGTRPLDDSPTAGPALVLAMLGHAVGWPIVRGGSQRLADAMVAYLRDLGGTVEVNRPVSSLASLPRARAILVNVTPRQLLAISDGRLPDAYARRLARFRHGPGIFKIDWALDAPIPWQAVACRQAGTLHLGGDLDEIAAAEAAIWRGEHPRRPFVLLSQPTLFDASRAPAGKHVAWAYCHVPAGSTTDMTAHIEAQVERFAPGFGRHILARSVMNTVALEQHNANNIGGDISGGVMDWGQLYTRPTPSWSPYTTPVDGLYLCSASTPPGGGVHGMGGYWAACTLLRRQPLTER